MAYLSVKILLLAVDTSGRSVTAASSGRCLILSTVLTVFRPIES